MADMPVPPFAPLLHVQTPADVLALEATPLAQSVRPCSTYALIRNSALAFGDKTALTFLPTAEPEPGPEAPVIRWSYAQLLARVHQTANALHKLGLQHHEAVAVLLPGCLEYHLALWGGAAAGIVQPLNPLLSDDKLAALMNAARARVLIAWGDQAHAGEDGLWAKAQRIRHRVPSLAHVLWVTPAHGCVEAQTETAIANTAADTAAKAAANATARTAARTTARTAADAASPAGVADFASLLAQEPDTHLISGRQVQGSDIAAYFHTGGTTGSPKLARHSHAAQVYTAWACVQLQGVKSSDVSINGYPLFHVAGVLPGALTSLSAGAETVIPTSQLFRNKAVISNYWRLVQKYRATVLSGVPTALAALAAVPVAGADISSLRYGRTGAAPMPADLAARLYKLIGIHVHESLGMTEMAGISTITPPGMRAPPGCVGIRLPYTQIRIHALDAQGGVSPQEVKPGQQGVVLFKSPNLFSGFLDEADNALAFADDDWLISGDLGWIDAQERLHLCGRSKDLIIRSGHNIDPKVIEDALALHPGVQMCAAVGAPDAYAGEVPVAFVTLVPGAEVSTEELMAFAAERVDEPPARPKKVTVLDAMPLTNVGKIYKPTLREMAAQQASEQAHAAAQLPS